jgi:hypothetical protein
VEGDCLEYMETKIRLLPQDFEALLEKIDQGLRALPATAQARPCADEKRN